MREAISQYVSVYSYPKILLLNIEVVCTKRVMQLLYRAELNTRVYLGFQLLNLHCSNHPLADVRNADVDVPTRNTEGVLVGPAQRDERPLWRLSGFVAGERFGIIRQPYIATVVGPATDVVPARRKTPSNGLTDRDGQFLGFKDESSVRPRDHVSIGKRGIPRAASYASNEAGCSDCEHLPAAKEVAIPMVHGPSHPIRPGSRRWRKQGLLL